MVKQLENTTLNINKQGILPLPSVLTPEAKLASILPQFRNSSLIEIGQLCNKNCIVVFDKQQLRVFKD